MATCNGVQPVVGDVVCSKDGFQRNKRRVQRNTRSKRRLAAVACSGATDDDDDNEDDFILVDIAKNDRELLLDGDDDDGDVAAAPDNEEQAIPMEFPNDNSCKSGDDGAGPKMLSCRWQVSVS